MINKKIISLSKRYNLGIFIAPIPGWLEFRISTAYDEDWRLILFLKLLDYKAQKNTSVVADTKTFQYNKLVDLNFAATMPTKKACAAYL